MKPAVNMDGKTTVVIPSVSQTEPVKKASKRKLLIVGVVIGLVSVIVVAGATLGAFYLGMDAAKNNYKEAWMTFNTGKGEEPIKEKVTIKEDTKEAEISEPGPGNMRMVIDYDKNMLVIQFYGSDTDGDDVVCYVHDYEPGMYGTLKDGLNAVSGGDKNLTVPMDSEGLEFESTGEVVSLDDLSPSAREMCQGAKVLRVVKTEHTGRQKKDICSYYRNSCYRKCRGWWLWRRCSWECTTVIVSYVC